MVYVVKQLYKAYKTFLVDYSGKYFIYSDDPYFRKKNRLPNKNFENFLDSKSDNLPLVNSPLIIFGIMAGYLYLVLSVGPRFMKNRKPFQIKKILIAYNAFQIVANVFVWIYVSVFLVISLI